jgi:pyridinium-3,5-bisthiocarboxylic acid mononucleotide nickel chelatase
MVKIAYLDCPTGISGDMCLGALIHAGVPLEYLIEKLNHLGIAHEYKLWAEFVHRNGQQATKLHVELVTQKTWVDNTAEGDPTPSALESLLHLQKDESSSPDRPHLHHAHEVTHQHSSTAEGKDQSEQKAVDPAHSQAHGQAYEPAQAQTHSPHGQAHEPAHDRAHGQAHEHDGRHISQHDSQHDSRHLNEIEHLIRAAQLPARVTAWSLAIFRRLAEAEGAVHGISPERVHFHEVGATDAIVDIVGTCLGLDWLGIEALYCSALPTGGGTVWAAHGRLPVPAPAVLKLWQMRQVPIYSNGIDRELVTPTGAAIVTTLAADFGPPPAMTLAQVGLGAGTHELSIPNILRLWIGESKEKSPMGLDLIAASVPAPAQTRQENSVLQGAIHPNAASSAQIRAAQSERSIALIEKVPTEKVPTEEVLTERVPTAKVLTAKVPTETIAVLQTQIDDLNPQAIGYLYEALFAVGALDVFTQAIGMKKSRPGILLTVLCHPQQRLACETVLFQETTTLGIRYTMQQRTVLEREIQTIQTPYGPIRIKIARWPQDTAIANIQPEYEDCAQLAQKHHMAWREVHRLALEAWTAQQKGTA